MFFDNAGITYISRSINRAGRNGREQHLGNNIATVSAIQMPGRKGLKDKIAT